MCGSPADFKVETSLCDRLMQRVVVEGEWVVAVTCTCSVVV